VHDVAVDSPDRRFCHGPVLVRRTRGAVLLLPADGNGDEPLALTGTAIATWDTFATARSVDEATAVLVPLFDGQPDQIRASVAHVVATLSAIGALEAVS
jgi:hypothetical protein